MIAFSEEYLLKIIIITIIIIIIIIIIIMDTGLAVISIIRLFNLDISA